MHVPKRQRLILLGAVLIIFVTAIPLLGLIASLFNPPSNPFVLEPPTLGALFQQTGALILLGNTLALALLVSGFSVGIGLWLAWVEQRTVYPGVKWLGILDLLPLAMPGFLLAIALQGSLGPGGVIGSIFNLPPFRGFFPTVIVLTLSLTPYAQLIISAALKRGSVAEEEAARGLGATRAKIFCRIIFPRLRPSFAFAWLIIVLHVLGDFGAPAILDAQVFTWRLYQAVSHQQLYQATLFGVIMMAIAIPLVLLARYIHGEFPKLTQVSNPRPTRRHVLGWPAKITTYLLHALIIGLGVILPLITLLSWIYQAWAHDIAFASLATPIRDTFKVTVLSAPIIVLLALLPAWIAARGPYKRLGLLLEQGTYLVSSLPGILLAFGSMITVLLIARFIQDGAWLYHLILSSGILLLLGYIMRFLSEAYAGVKSAILLFDQRLSDSARLLNVGLWRYTTQIMLPALRPGLIVSLTLVLIGLIKELPITLLLGGAMGLRTLSYQVYDYYSLALLHDAALAGIVILLVSFSLLIITLRWRRHV